MPVDRYRSINARAELIGNVAPGFTGGLAIGLDEDLPNSGRDDRLLALTYFGYIRATRCREL
jgi:hypothetical protein